MDDSNDLFASLGKQPAAPNRTTTLSHYTDLGAFIGILSKGQLWASNIRFLNDSREMEFGLDTAKELFKDFLRLYPGEVPKQFRRFDPITGNTIPDVYACCFCEEGDMLSQWRGYGLSRQSVSIQFDYTALEYMTGTRKQSLTKVIYGKSEARKYLREQLTMDGVSFSEVEDLLDDTTAANFNKVRTQTIFRHAPRFKDDGFREEREWRIIITDGEANPSYRVGNNVVIPYRIFEGEMPFPPSDLPSRLPITSITIGPGKDLALTEKSVRHFLDAKGYDRVAILHSKIPFRA